MQIRSARLVVASDVALFREGLRTVVQPEPGFSVVGEAADLRATLRLANELKPDVLLLDWRMPGLPVLQELPSSAESARVILVGPSMDGVDVRDALAHGARGLVLAQSGPAVLIEAIRRVMAGQYWFGHDSVADLVQSLRDHLSTSAVPPSERHFGLTARELEIVSAVAAGCCNKEIAQKLSISAKTDGVRYCRRLHFFHTPSS